MGHGQKNKDKTMVFRIRKRKYTFLVWYYFLYLTLVVYILIYIIEINTEVFFFGQNKHWSYGVWVICIFFLAKTENLLIAKEIQPPIKEQQPQTNLSFSDKKKNNLY